MRPVRLTMQALGPYAGREVVDFRDAVAAGLFGIYGQTGAGKSTIFSAMTFALFGEAARPEQDIASLRSDHAEPDVPTEVELIFEVGERRYVVRRQPEQMRPKRRGGGETQVPHEAYLFDATGLALEDILQETPGKVVAEKKVGAVRSAIAEILGYGAAEFRQIVLLPQGKFEAFLTARTNERLTILRELFDVSQYRRLAERLKSDANEATQRVSRGREVCAARLAQEGFDTADALTEAIVAARAAHEAARGAEAAAVAGEQAARAALEAGRQQDAAFAAAETAGKRLDELSGQRAAMDALGKRLEAVERARSVVDVEDHFVRWQADEAEASTAVAAARTMLEAAEQAAAASAARLEAERASEREIEALRRTVERLEAHAETLAAAESLSGEAGAARDALAEAETALQGAQEQVATLAGRCQKGEQTVSDARRDGEQRQRLAAEHEAAQRALAAAEAFERVGEALNRARQRVAAARTAQAEAEGRRAAAVAAEADAEAALRGAQAFHLAATLTPGSPCPVCGAAEHPAPATGRPEHAGLAAALAAARDTLSAADTHYNEVASTLASAEATAVTLAAQVEAMDAPAGAAADIRERRDGVAAALAALPAARDMEMLERALAALKSQLQDAETAREARRTARENLATEAAGATARLSQALSAVPEPLRAPAALQAALAGARADLATRRKRLQDAEAAASTARDNLLTGRKGAEAATRDHARIAARCAGAGTAFQARLAEAGLDEAAYRARKSEIAHLAADRVNLDTYRTSVRDAQNEARRTAEAIAGATRPDLAALGAVLATAEAARGAAATALADAATRATNLVRLADSLAETERQLAAFEAETAPLRELAACFNARNSAGMTLETFAIGAMFEAVLLAANQRLGPMTRGRFTLERVSEQVDRRSQTGLGICVFDLFTGKRRPTTTLSGGETFIAALALALGLSDVVESISGKVRLDTIFIDEGFGSLDTQDDGGTLEQVLQALTELTRGTRAIGVISHVPLVQEAIPRGFYVRQQDARGSRVEARAA